MNPDQKAQSQVTTLHRIYREMLAAKHLGWTRTQIDEWFMTRNEIFGGLKPIHLVSAGHHASVERKILRALEHRDPAQRLTLNAVPERPMIKGNGRST
jgi:hypothetical protein